MTNNSTPNIISPSGPNGGPGMYEDSADITGGDLTWPPPKSPPEGMRKGDKSHLPNGGWRVAGAGQPPSGSTGMEGRQVRNTARKFVW